jgi:polysaccharide export outer membrane protein
MRHLTPLLLIGWLALTVTACSTSRTTAPKQSATDRSFVVSGEVNLPGPYTLPSDSLNVAEALNMAGDITVFGKRNKIRVTRRDDSGKFRTKIFNLDNPDKMIASDFFYVKPGDFIYVSPNKARTESTKFGKKSTIWVSITSTMISVGELIIQKLMK